MRGLGLPPGPGSGERGSVRPGAALHQAEPGGVRRAPLVHHALQVRPSTALSTLRIPPYLNRNALMNGWISNRPSPFCPTPQGGLLRPKSGQPGCGRGHQGVVLQPHHADQGHHHVQIPPAVPGVGRQTRQAGTDRPNLASIPGFIIPRGDLICVFSASWAPFARYVSLFI